ncbi:putative aminoadipate-semialdehyde dehydrogenase [Xylariaceae sp. FL1651]|nr:putative aminoadipate-semialdehyde dehydrogenase [Xylariaceae sp. FL1651]
MSKTTVLSRRDVNDSTLAEISKTCNLPLEQIVDIYSCTPLQIATIVESAIHAGASVFQFVLTLSPLIELDGFCAALQQVVSLNSVLRTRFVECRYGLVQVITNEMHYTQRISGDLQEYLRMNKGLPLSWGAPLFRSGIIDRKLVLTIHHGIADHASLTPLFDDVLSVYHGREPRKRADFKDFVAHCLEIDESTAKAFWEPRFRGAPAIFPKVEFDYIPLATQLMTRKITLNRIDEEFSLAHMPSFIEAAWALTASTYTGNENVAFGLVLSGRTSCSAAAETTLGPTIAVLPVQVNLKHDTTLEGILKDSAAARRQLQTHSALQYGLTRIRTVSEAARIAAGFQTLLNIRPRWYDPKEASEVTYDYMDEPHGAFALALSCDLEDAIISVRAMFDPAVLCERQMGRILQQFEHYLQSLFEAPRKTKLSHIPRLNSHDLSEVISMNNKVHEQGRVYKCIHELFSTKSQEQPTVIAVDAHDGCATYGELEEMSDRLAQELRRKGVTAECPVAFIFEKSMWTVVSILSIMKAGGACVPIATSDPATRKATVISRVAAKIILTSTAEYKGSLSLAPSVIEISAESISRLPKAVDANMRWKSSPENLAYILFTSGSTGLPKGVMLEHRNLASSLQCLISTFGWNSDSRILQFASHVWDASIGEIMGALLSGGCLCIPSGEARESDLIGFIKSSEVNCAALTPTVYRTLSPDELPGLKSLVSIGEAIPPDASKTWGKARRLFNGWGPCEASIISSVAELTPDSPYPQSIGNPINCSLWIANPRNVNELAPIGAVGEILIEGSCVARGYLEDDSKTKMSFIKPPLWAPPREGRLCNFYRTGDMAKYYPDGSICFVGRQDSQIKIRGQRLELGEVEGIIAGCSKVRDVSVTTKIHDGRTELVAIICLENSSLPRNAILQELSHEHSKVSSEDLRAARDHAHSRLPLYMVPTIWLAVEKLPRTSSAKVDRVAINQWLKTKNLSSARAALNIATGKSLTPPSTTQERLIQSIWSSVLSIPESEIGCESFFGQLGGDSILAMQVVGQARKRGLRISAASLLGSKTLTSIAKTSTAIQPAPENAVAPTNATPRDGQIIEQITATLTGLSGLNQHLRHENIDAIVPATDGQTTMLALSETGGRGYYIDFTLDFKPHLKTARLRRACEEVIQNHSILRTVFVCHSSTIQQIVLKASPPNRVVEETGKYTPNLAFRQGISLARFHLMSDGHTCQRLRLEIHHALYDAVSLGLIFRDLDAAYTGRPLSDGPEHHTWVLHVEMLGDSAPRKFWKEVLQGASMPFLVPPIPGAIRCHPLDEHIQIFVPLQKMKTSLGTPSSMIKAAWSILISFALDTDDVMFGEVTANRFLPFPGIEEVKGPCVNLIPVRARLNADMTLADLVSQIQDLSVAGMPHQHVRTGSIMADCSPWPSWTRFSTALVYQNHASVHDTLRIGDADAVLSNRGKLGDSTDIHLIATPCSDELEIELHYSSLTIPSEQIKWIVETLAKILDFFPSGLHKNLGEVKTDVHRAMGPYLIPSSCAAPSSGLFSDSPPPSAEALETVAQAWAKAKLYSRDPKEARSMWDCGATVLTTLLLSESYRACGYNISAEDIVRSPNVSMQARLVDSRKMSTDAETSAKSAMMQKQEVNINVHNN